MKHILIGLALGVFASTAHGDPELARAFSGAAAELGEETRGAIEGRALPADYGDELARFSVNAARLARWIDDTGRPSDFGCIFRGMAEEAELQLAVIDATHGGETALRRLAALFHDAESVGLAASLSQPGERGRASGAGPDTCAANPAAALQYLTEQP